MNYYERHLGDYIKDTVSLSMLEDGAYNRLIDQAYQTEEPLPLDVKEVYRMARATSGPERKAVDYVLGKFWTRTDDGYVQKRIQAEIERFQDKQRKAKASADARWNKSKGNANASESHDANGMRTHSEGNAHQTPDTRHQTPDLKPGVTTRGDTSTVVGAICVGLRRSGVQVSPHQLQVQELAKQVDAGTLAVETILAAGEEARSSKPNERIGIGLVTAILTSWATKAKAMNVAGARQPAQHQSSRDAQRAGAMNSIGLGVQHDEQPLTIDAATGDISR
ncbi:YdaU family protein [Herbaspirillum sp. CAH-3]|uniref:YdaU family protein n=1 Tax=Herbaspirillum sp. CAH-3 TaxID=2605746 RepID=UPI0012ACB1BD|nr:YdaU family protein [Herbaspirillum sp. CAH-3]MRT30797.1 DUF1376 domain-containing protein [Herbaspirillum sp. CAH-3]